MFLEVEEGGQDPDEEAVKVYLIRIIADLPLSWYSETCLKRPPIGPIYELAIVDRWSLGVVSNHYIIWSP